MNVKAIAHNQPIIITGMHKSGTSLTASTLQAAGVHIGKNLMGPGPGNRLGHFEDMDLYSLHCDILKSQGIHMDGWTSQTKFDIPQPFQERALDLLQDRREPVRLWGWKDPRTTLFLDFWKRTIPNAKFVFVYRKPWEVVDSLFRRGDSTFISHPRMAIKSWIAYNQAILKFYRENKDESFLFNVDNFRDEAGNGEKQVIARLCRKLDIRLDLPNRAVYQQNELQTPAKSNHCAMLVHKRFPQAFKLYEALGFSADLPWAQDAYSCSSTASDLSKDWGFQDWMCSRKNYQALVSA
ncbi:MAG: sulfotransferase family protein [Phormidesmis sp.]